MAAQLLRAFPRPLSRPPSRSLPLFPHLVHCFADAELAASAVKSSLETDLKQQAQK